MNLKKRQQVARIRANYGGRPWLEPKPRERSCQDKMYDAIENALEANIDVYFVFPMQRLHSIGFANFTLSSDGVEDVICRVDQTRYKLSERYKITLRPVDSNFAHENFYQSDLHSLMTDNVGSLWIDGKEYRLDRYNPPRKVSANV